MKRWNQLPHDNRGGVDQYLGLAVTLILGIMVLMALLQGGKLAYGLIEMNNIAESVSKKIQLTGTVDTQTQQLLNESLEASIIHDYKAVVTIDAAAGTEKATITQSSVNTKQIQLSDAYTVVVTGQVKIFFKDVTVGGKAVGISEVYFK